MGKLRRELLRPKQLIPIRIQRILSCRDADSTSLDNEQFLLAVQRHAGYVQGGDVPSDQLADGVRRVSKVKSSGFSIF